MKTKADLPQVTPTEEQFTALNEAYKYFNRKLFNNQLPGCILNFSRKKNTHGFLAPSRWRRVQLSHKATADEVGENVHYVHEISLTPYTLYREPKLVFSTLVHELVHLWQWEFGSPSRNGYHNKEWAAKMEEVGLIPSDTGQPGGKKTGQSMTHYIAENGKYETVFSKLPEAYLLPFTSVEGDLIGRLINGMNGPNGSNPNSKNPNSSKKTNLIRPGRKKTKYSCPSCKANVWGKPKLEIRCVPCDTNYEVQI